jgi:hypothetical protein
MVDENKNKTIARIVAFVGIISIIAVIIFIMIFIINNNAKEKNILNYLKKEKYTQSIKNLYSKTLKNNHGQIKYSYNFAINTFKKSIVYNGNNFQEQVILSYNEKYIKVDYFYSSNVCSLIQNATQTNDEFTCNVNKKVGPCKIRCDVIKKYINNFTKETKTLDKISHNSNSLK